jgi:hypothetical protein
MPPPVHSGIDTVIDLVEHPGNGDEEGGPELFFIPARVARSKKPSDARGTRSVELCGLRVEWPWKDGDAPVVLVDSV